MGGKARKGEKGRRVQTLCVLGVLGVLSAKVAAQFEMPDMKQMSGIPRPVADLPDRTISVRLIRGDLSHNGTSLLEGSSPQATTAGAHVVVQGPFAPGRTFVQVGCDLPALTGSLRVEQRLPARLEQLGVVVKKLGATRLTSPQIANQQDMTA